MRLDTIELRDLFKDVSDKEMALKYFNFCKKHMRDPFELRMLQMIYDKKIKDIEFKDSIIAMSDRELLEKTYIMLKEREDK